MVKSGPPAPRVHTSVADSIVLVRGQRILLDSTLAALYAVETRALLQALRRNPERFPADFCFQLNAEEVEILRSQIVISSPGWGGRRTPPYAFTEQGVAMLSSVLRSPAAIAVNVEIMRAFVSLRRVLSENEALARQFLELENRLKQRLTEQDHVIQQVLKAIRDLMRPAGESSRPIGFVIK